jgi:hypothetical protein
MGPKRVTKHIIPPRGKPIAYTTIERPAPATAHASLQALSTYLLERIFLWAVSSHEGLDAIY